MKKKFDHLVQHQKWATQIHFECVSFCVGWNYRKKSDKFGQNPAWKFVFCENYNLRKRPRTQIRSIGLIFDDKQDGRFFQNSKILQIFGIKTEFHHLWSFRRFFSDFLQISNLSTSSGMATVRRRFGDGFGRSADGPRSWLDDGVSFRESSSKTNLTFTTEITCNIKIKNSNTINF